MRPGAHHTRKVLPPLLAGLSLALNALLVAFLAPKPTAASPVVYVDCHRAYGVPELTDRRGDGDDRRSCCVLCGDLGYAPDAGLAAISAPALRLALRVGILDNHHAGSARAVSVLPVGARAPPLLG